MNTFNSVILANVGMDAGGRAMQDTKAEARVQGTNTSIALDPGLRPLLSGIKSIVE